MELTEQQIASILTKDITCKTILINPTEVEKTVDQYLKDGWELVNKVPLNDRVKITFRKVK